MSSWFSSWIGPDTIQEATVPVPTGPLSTIPSAAALKHGSFATGEVVEYFSSSLNKWIPAKVLQVNPSGTYDLDCKPDVPIEKIRQRAQQQAISTVEVGPSYHPGDLVEYFGATQGRWVPAKVLQVNPNGTYNLDCKPNVMPEKIRRTPGTAGALGTAAEPDGSTYQVSDTVEYFGATLGKWIPAKVLKANPDGTFDLDCKPGVVPAKMRRTSMTPVPAAIAPLGGDAGAGPPTVTSYKAGDIVSYFSTSLGKWIPAKVLAVKPGGTYDLDCKPDVPFDKMRPLEHAAKTGDFGTQPVASHGGGGTAAFKAGDVLEYLGTTLNAWIPAKVLRVNADGTFDLDCKPGVLPDRVRPRPLQSSTPVGALGTCELISDRYELTGPTGYNTAYFFRQGYSRSAAGQHPTPPHAVGDVVEYFAASNQQWIRAKVLSLNADGTYGLDCKPNVAPSRIRLPGDTLGSVASVASSLGRGRSELGSGTFLHLAAGSPAQGKEPACAAAVGSMASVVGQHALPVQLLRAMRRGRRWHFEVCPEGAKVLERHGQRRIAVTSVCGPAKSGKSFLMNVLSERLQKGLPAFQVGSDAPGGTDGAWLWAVADEDDEKSPLLAFLDCQGFGSADAECSCDSHLMTLCVLLSSTFLLNSRGCLNEELFQSLAAACRFGDNMEERGNEAHRPSLVWVLRDFASHLRDSRGNFTTPDEYLEKALHQTAPEEHDQEMGQVTREVRQTLLKFFRHRSCVELAQPADESQLDHLDGLPYSSLSTDFQSGVEKFRGQMLAMGLANPKLVGGQPLGCFAFVLLLRQLVAAVNEDRILNMRSAWETMQHTICGTLADELRNAATAMLRSLAAGQPMPGGAQLPLTDDALHTVLRDQRHSLKSQWEGRAIGSEAVRKEYWQELKETLVREEALVRVQNVRLADQRLMEVLRAWQEWLDNDDGKQAPVETICGQFGGTTEKMPAMPLSRAGRAALLAVARRVAASRSTVAARMAQQEGLQRKAVEWGEQAAQQEEEARSKLKQMKAELQEVQDQAIEAEQALAQLEREVATTSKELQDNKGCLQNSLAEIEAARTLEHELKAAQRVTVENIASMQTELEQCQAAAARMDAERLATERCTRTTADALATEQQRLKAEMEDAKVEVERYRHKIEQERAHLRGENEKVLAEHQHRVEDVRKQLEEERKLLRGEQERTRTEHLRMVDDARRQLDKERKALHGKLDDHKGRLIEHERGAGLLEGQAQALTAENATLHQRLDELEDHIRQAEVVLAQQTQEKDHRRTELAKVKAELEEVQTNREKMLQAQAKELERWFEEELNNDDRQGRPKCGCTVQ